MVIFSLIQLATSREWTVLEEEAFDNTITLVSGSINATFGFVNSKWYSTGIPKRIQSAIQRKELGLIKSVSRELLPPILMKALSQANKEGSLPQLIKNNLKEVLRLCKSLSPMIQRVGLPLLVVSENKREELFRMLLMPNSMLQNATLIEWALSGNKPSVTLLTLLVFILIV